MKKIKLGKQGLEVPAIGLGCMGMSEFYGDSDERQNLNILDKAIALGCNFWDTADMYGPFTNEQLLAKALKGRREKIILATKFGIKRGDNGEWLGVAGSADYVKKSCEDSLKRLGTDYIDLYYQHRVDPEVAIEETVGAMADLVKEGKVKYIGLSEADASTLEKANQVHPISALQTEYSLWSRDVEKDILPMTRKLGIGFVAYSPLGRGFLTGVIRKRSDLQTGDWRLENPRFSEQAIDANAQLVEFIEQLAVKKSFSSAQLALAWVLSRGDDIATIPGTRQEKYLIQNWTAQTLKISTEELNIIDSYSASFNVSGERY